MTTITVKCSRCHGTGRTGHLNVEFRGRPGGCFNCFGVGTVERKAPTPRHLRETAEQRRQRSLDETNARLAQFFPNLNGG